MTPTHSHSLKRKSSSFRFAGRLAAGLLFLACGAALHADQSAAFSLGNTFSISVSTDGSGPLNYQWRKNGADISGATSAVYSVSSAQITDAGSYSVTVGNSVGSASSDIAVITIASSGTSAVVNSPATNTTSATTPVGTTSAGTSPVITSPLTSDSSTSGSSSDSGSQSAQGGPVTSRLANVSIRTSPGTGSQSLIAGFVTSGGSKSVLLRGVGPGLAAYTSAATFADPALDLYQGSSDTPIISNDNWGGTTALKAAFSQLGAFSLPDTSKDAAILTTVTPNAYSVQLTGTGNGLAIAEIYDADPTSAARIVNLSARTQVGTGDNVLIAGFVISGTGPKKLLIRAVGPTLASYGVTGTLSDPRLDLYVAGGTTAIQSNDNWGGTAALTAAFASCGAFSLPDVNSKDAAMIVTLNPGAYSAVVSGVGNTTGVALVEIYELP